MRFRTIYSIYYFKCSFFVQDTIPCYRCYDIINQQNNLDSLISTLFFLLGPNGWDKLTSKSIIDQLVARKLSK